MKAIRIERPGPDYRLVLEDCPAPQPRAGEVLIAVAAAGLNRADLLQAQGRYPPPAGAPQTPGLEVAGTIAALGPEVSGFSPGEKVCALLPGGGYAELATASAACVLPLPPGLDLAAAGGLPEGLFTAWTNVVDTARLAPGETLLVHGGTSGIGSLAIQVFAARGHTVFATAGTPEKCAACLALGARHAIDYNSEDFVTSVKAQTQDRGVDVILDIVGGDYIQRNLAAAAPRGRIVNIAYQKGFKAEVDFTPLLVKRLTLAASTLRARSTAEKGAIRDALLREVWPLLATGRVKPVIDRTFPLAEADAAHRAMAAGGHVGKILLKVRPR
jgi:putative PIG3 family NAD(P)H quinone oxidoreductase